MSGGREAARSVVLKFGSSVLAGADGFRLAAQEVLARVARGRRVCAVVSARPGTTDDLWRAAIELDPAPEPELAGELLATGESASVHLLRIALRHAGVSSLALSVEELDLRTEGPALDATPVALDERELRYRLELAPVVVVPGFIGRDAGGGATLLGRGGSDLTALFIGWRLGAECRLVKDVDGLYDGDPNVGRPRRRYLQASWQELARVGQVVVQPKAVRFARERGIRFRVAAVGREGTCIGPGPERFEEIAS